MQFQPTIHREMRETQVNNSIEGKDTCACVYFCFLLFCSGFRASPDGVETIVPCALVTLMVGAERDLYFVELTHNYHTEPTGIIDQTFHLNFS